METSMKMLKKLNLAIIVLIFKDMDYTGFLEYVKKIILK